MSIPVLAHAVRETLAIASPTLVEAARGTLDVGICNERLYSWAKKLLERADIRLTVEGREHLPDTDETFVVMSNHQSHYDIPTVFHAYGRPLRMVAKKELFRVPIWGRAMRVAKFVELDRANRDRAIESLNAARETLRSGISIWIAPEGTRSRTGELGEFKKGGFHLALGTDTRILPVSIMGTRQVLPAKGRRVRPGADVRVVFSEPVDVTAYGQERKDDLRAEVRTRIAQHLPY